MDTRAIKPPPFKIVDPYYRSAEHIAWREAVVRRAGGRCEWAEDGRRCERSEPEHRIFADHIVERNDGGVNTDPANGRALCGAHHGQKTAVARDERLKR